jgi:hypothetical protein
VSSIRYVRYSVADPDPGSGAFLPPGSGMLLSRIRPIFVHKKATVLTKFGNSLYTKMSDPGSGAFLPLGSGMEQWSDPDPG